ncbi:sulfatase-like hydrolase/transferase [Halorussus salilacus]|uniref:sulfatase n=1 Tax=Halorussus salilacus TaxID=2953750 RepID=UPI0020A12B7F|nr:sulfatase [Halorussus salilacus]USZ67396.1 sulfatase-like hydrolase/transferase [Halorussus salilacus]
MKRNVVYITVDSIRADHVGYVGYDEPTTPNIDELAAEGTTYSRTIANGIPTYYSFKSLLGGVHSLSHSRDIGLPQDATSIAEVFERAGYETAGFNAGNPWLTRNYGYHRGFDTFRDFMTDDVDEPGVSGETFEQLKQYCKKAVDGSDWLTDKLGFAGRLFCAINGHIPLETAETVTEHATDWLARDDIEQPFFLWIHYMDPHYPWVPPSEYLTPFGDDDISTYDIGRLWHLVAHLHENDPTDVSERNVEKIRTLYDAEIRRTDAAIGRVVDELKRQGVYDETVISVAGDHGTELYDHGKFSHGPRTLFDEIVNVPLVLKGPGIPSDEHERAQLVDVPPTLASKAGLSQGLIAEFEGDDLFDRRPDGVTTEVVYDYDPALGKNRDNDLLQARTCWPWKLVRNLETGETRLYHLESDPGEYEDVSEDHPETVQELGNELDEFRRRVVRRNETLAEKRWVRERLATLRDEGVV